MAGISAIVGTVFGIKALGDKRDFDDGDRTTDRVESIEKNAVIADMAFGAALALGVTGAVLWWNQKHDEPTVTARIDGQSAFALAPIVTRGGSGASALVRF